MKTKRKIYSVIVGIIALISLLGWYLSRHTIAILEPAGEIARKERNLLIFTVLLGLIVVVPLFSMTIFIVWKYRESNSKAKYSPNWDGHRAIEFSWWAIPSIIIIILGVVTWNSSYALSPYKAISSKNSQMTIQVVALDWKWLFIYPQQNIASVNYFKIPVNVPVNFEITSDSVMNSFWIPQLSGQIYAMPGMETQLHLIANKVGNFYGESANISGQGFSSMTFTAAASSKQDFNAWIKQAKAATRQLSSSNYARLALPSLSNSVSYYSTVASNLFSNIAMSYMGPPTPSTSTPSKLSNGYINPEMSMP